MLTCAGARPVSGAHEAPHGVIAGVAVLPVEAVPATCEHSHHVRAEHPGASARLAAWAPGTHLPEKGATADCPWIPSGSSCKGEGGTGGQGGRLGLQDPALGRKGSFHLSPGARAGRTGAPAARSRRARAAPPAVARPGRWRSRGGRAVRGCVVRGKSPRPPPRGTRCNLGAGGRAGGAVFAGLGISWDARWCLETEKSPP